MAFDFKGGKQAPKPNKTTSSNDEYSSSLSSLSRPPGNSSSSGGFKNTPETRDNSGKTGGSSPQNLSSFNDRQKGTSSLGQIPNNSREVRRVDSYQIPWRIVFPIIAIIAIAVVGFVFRDAITSFLAQVLTGLLSILIIIVIIKWLIFPRRWR